MSEKIILVDEKDNFLGYIDKIEAHRKCILHRAFSIFIFNSKNEILLQKRASNKYHSGGLWSNTCCSHPKNTDLLVRTAQRRLKEEMGIVCDIHEIFSFIYKAKLDPQLFEFEYDHVFAGKFDGDPLINKNEVEDWRWVNIECTMADIDKNPDIYTFWYKYCLKRLIFELNKKGF